MADRLAFIATYGAGEDPEVVGALAAAWAKAGTRVVDVCPDATGRGTAVHGVGEPDAVERGALAAAAIAVRTADGGTGADRAPLLGAVDSLTLAPLADGSADTAGDLARRIGHALALDLGLPVYLFGSSAPRAEQHTLGAVREAVGAPTAGRAPAAGAPDLGPPEVGPAGVTAVGTATRGIDLSLRVVAGQPGVATAVARALDAGAGGLAEVAASGRDDPSTTTAATVVVHIGDVGRTPLHRVVELARLEARRHGASVEAVTAHGLVPQSSVAATAEWYLGLEGFHPDQILAEGRSEAAVEPDEADGLRRFVNSVGSAEATPGGGSVASLAGALAAALAGMVAGLTIGRPKHAEVELQMQRVRRTAGELQEALLELMAADSEAFEGVMAAYRLPRDTSDAADRRRDAIQAALRRATEVPVAVIQRAVEVLRLAREVAVHGNPNAVSDAGVAAYLGHAAAQSASLNVAINVMGLRDLEEGDRYRRASSERLVEARALADEVDRVVRERIKG